VTVSEEKLFEVLYDHYKDSFSHIKGYQALRNRLYLYAVTLLAILQVSSPETGPKAVAKLAETHLGSQLQVSPALVGALLGVVLLVVVLRYFQTSATIDLQYDLLHEQEEQLCEMVGGRPLFVRERSGYTDDKPRPLFRRFVGLLYRWLFPVLLLVGALAELRDAPAVFTGDIEESAVLAVKTLLFGATSVTIVLHLAMVHCPKNDE